MVLVAGGEDDTFNVITNAELYNPTSGSFTATGSLNQQRSFHMVIGSPIPNTDRELVFPAES